MSTYCQNRDACTTSHITIKLHFLFFGRHFTLPSLGYFWWLHRYSALEVRLDLWDSTSCTQILQKHKLWVMFYFSSPNVPFRDDSTMAFQIVCWKCAKLKDCSVCTKAWAQFFCAWLHTQFSACYSGIWWGNKPWKTGRPTGRAESLKIHTARITRLSKLWTCNSFTVKKNNHPHEDGTTDL